MEHNSSIKGLKLHLKSNSHYKDLHYFNDLEYLYIDIHYIRFTNDYEHISIIKSIEVNPLLKHIYLNFIYPISITEEMINTIIDNLRVPFGCEVNISCPIYKKTHIVKLHNAKCKFTTKGKLESVYNLRTVNKSMYEGYISCHTCDDFTSALKYNQELNQSS